LRERRPDIPLLVDHFLARAGRTGDDRAVTETAMGELLEWSWPGNVRELEHVVERTLVHAAPGPLKHFEMGSVADASGLAREALTSDRLRRLLEHHGGRLAPVAEHLGVSIRTVQRRMKDFGLSGRDFR
jgi:DNA-binding NtrC family response regulator